MTTLAYRTVTEVFDDGSGTAMEGTGIITASAVVYNGAIPVVTPDAPVQCTIVEGLLKNAAGGDLQLLPTDTGGLAVEGQTAFWYWTVAITLGATQLAPWSFFLPAGDLSPVELYSLTGGGGGGGGGGFTNPMTTEGDIIVEDATPAPGRLAGNASLVSKFLNSKGDGTDPAVPAWKAIAPADLAAVPANPGPGNTLALTPAGLLTWSPYPWRFYLDSFGGVGDGQVLNDVAMGNGSANASSASGGFAAAVAGMPILVSGAGGSAGVHLCTTIQTVHSATSVTLSAAASSAVTAAISVYGSNNLAAARLQLAGAYAYWQAHPGGTELVVDPLVYAMQGSPVVGGGTLGNGMISLPAVSPVGPKFLPQWTGSQDVTPLMDFQQTMPQAVGAFFACLSQTGTNDGTFGPTYMIGGPIDGYGGEPGLFNNVVPHVRGLGLLLPWNTNIGGFDWLGEAGFVMDKWAVMPMGVVASGPAPNIGSPGNLTNTWAIAGVRAACAGNNDDCNFGHGSVEGMVYGVMPSEHSYAEYLSLINCITGIEVYSGISSMVHAARIAYASVESCINGVGVFDEGKIDIATLDVENLSSIARDTGSTLNGYIGVRGDIGAGYNSSSLLATAAGGAQLEIVNLNNAPGPVASPVGPPLTTVAQLNGYNKRATWYVSASGGITGISVDAAALGLTAAANAVIAFEVPAGHTWTPAYSGTMTVHQIVIR